MTLKRRSLLRRYRGRENKFESPSAKAVKAKRAEEKSVLCDGNKENDLFSRITNNRSPRSSVTSVFTLGQRNKIENTKPQQYNEKKKTPGGEILFGKHLSLKASFYYFYFYFLKRDKAFLFFSLPHFWPNEINTKLQVLPLTTPERLTGRTTGQIGLQHP